ncbi:hypothetical protein [Corallococcus caeni]
MSPSVKKFGKLLLAVAIGAAASFGTTVAASSGPSEQSQSLACVGSHGGSCVNDCIEDGFDYGRCYGDCVCFYAY